MSDDFEAQFNEEKPETTEGQPRDEGGRFATKQADAPVEPVAHAVEPAPVAPAPVEPAKPEASQEAKGLMLAMLDEREKRQAIKKEFDDYKARTQTPEAPPTFQTPEDIQAYVQREAANAAWSAKVDFSENSAREKHGDATVEAAMAWNMAKCEAEKAALGFSPWAVEQMRQRHPVDWVVRQHKRDAFINEIGDDPEAYRAKIRAELAAQSATEIAPSAPAAVPQPVAPKPPPPRPSLASAPTAGGMQTVPVVTPFEATFK